MVVVIVMVMVMVVWLLGGGFMDVGWDEGMEVLGKRLYSGLAVEVLSIVMYF